MEEDISWVDIEIKSLDHDCNIIFDKENKLEFIWKNVPIIRLGFKCQIVQMGFLKMTL